MKLKREFKSSKKIKKIDNAGFKLVIIILICIVAIILMRFTYTKYVNKDDNATMYIAKNFYFESDLLKEDSNLETYVYQKGIESISINLNNNEDELRFSEVSIEYKVEITDTNGNSVKDKNGNIIIEKTGTLGNAQIESTNIKFENLPSGNYVVTATSISPYKKILKGNFTITNNDENIIYSVKDAVNSPTLQLTILTQDYNGNLKIKWPQGVTPDNTNKDFEDVNTGYEESSKIIEYYANSEYVIQFFKEDITKKYTDSDFLVERSN